MLEAVKQFENTTKVWEDNVENPKDYAVTTAFDILAKLYGYIAGVKIACCLGEETGCRSSAARLRVSSRR